jgi:hypothetical protein
MKKMAAKRTKTHHFVSTGANGHFPDPEQLILNPTIQKKSRFKN